MVLGAEPELNKLQSSRGFGDGLVLMLGSKHPNLASTPPILFLCMSIRVT